MKMSILDLRVCERVRSCLRNWRSRARIWFVPNTLKYSSEEVGQMLNEFQRAVEDNDEERIRWIFADYLPESNLGVEKKMAAVNGHKKDEKYFAHASNLGLAEK